MKDQRRPGLVSFVSLGIMAFIYFALYPADIVFVLTPLERILELTNRVSPWLYAVIGVAISCWTAFRLWGPNPRSGQQ